MGLNVVSRNHSPETRKIVCVSDLRKLRILSLPTAERVVKRRSEMAQKTILVTGSTGWLGGKLCEALVARGVNVVGMARRDTEVAGVMSVRADLATGAGLEKLQGLEFDCCVHLAAVAGWGELGDCLEVNVPVGPRIGRGGGRRDDARAEE